MHNLPRRVALIVALGIATATLPARAADDAAASAAREHYEKGTTFYDLGRYGDAIKEFEAAYEIKNAPALLFNLGQSHRLAGNAEQAVHFYRTYLRRDPKGTNRAEAEKWIAELEQQIARKNTAGAVPPPITPPTGTTPPPESAQPPQTGPGAVVPVTPVTPPPGTTPGPEAPPPPGTSAAIATQPAAPAATAAERARKLKVAGIATAAGGGLLIIIGAIEGGRAVAAANEVDKATMFDYAVEKRGLSAQHIGTGFLVVGVLAAAAGGGLYYYGLRTERAAAAQVAIAPVATAHGAGALLRVTF